MKTTVITCDICKKSVGENETSRMSIQTRGITFDLNRFSPAKDFDICKDCLKKHGFVVERPDTSEEVNAANSANLKTLERKLLDILEDLGVAFVE